MPPVARWVLLNAVLGLAYFAAARAGMATAIGPAGVTALWPPSGLALAALMLWRWQALPGLALGAFWLNWQSFLVPLHGPGPTAWWGAVGLSLSSMLQAGLVAAAVHQVPQRLASQAARQTLRFAGCVALGCTVATTLGNAWLWGHGSLPSDVLAYSWLVWWAGDCAGMLVVAPPLLLWLHPVVRRDPIASLAFPIVCIGLGLSLITAFIVGHLEREARIEQFRARSRSLAAELQQGIDLSLRDLEVLGALYYRTEIDQDEFRAQVTPMRQRTAWALSMGWLPRLDSADEGQARFGRLWTEPREEWQRIGPLQEADDPVVAPALRRAHQEGLVSASVPLADPNAPPGAGLLTLRLYAPVMDLGVHRSLNHQPERVRGMLSLTLDLAALLQTQGRSQGLQQLQLAWYDTNTPTPVGLSWDGQQARLLPPGWQREASGLAELLLVRLADRDWRLLARPRQDLHSLAPSWLQLGVLGGGMAFTALLAGFSVLRRRRDLDQQDTRRRLEAEVADRTHDLRQANQRLQQELHERQALEAALREASAQADSANRAKSMFLANMSHEIRTPLNAVIGYAQLLREDPELAAPVRERVAAIAAAGRRLLRLINDVLDLSKIESGNLSLQAERFEVWDELDELLRLLRPRIEAKGLRLDCDIALPRPTWMQGDRHKIGQILLNLLGNSLKFTQAGHIAVRVSQTGALLRIEVEDTGPGLPPAEAPTLFLPFQQGESGREKGGTGLGLALSRRLAHAMGGELTLRNLNGPGPGPGPGPSTGTLATLVLPQTLPDEALAGAPVAWTGLRLQRVDPNRPCRLLVAEDDADSRAILVHTLATLGCEVLQAHDGEAAWHALRQQQQAGQAVDLVFTDIRMPALDGLGLLRRVRAEPSLHGLPLVAVSASSLEHERRFYVAQGFQDFVGKPYDFSQIHQMLLRHLPDHWQPLATPSPAPAAADPSPEPAPAWGPALLQALEALAHHARNGDLQAVRDSLDALPASTLGATARQRLDAAVRQYDFIALADLASTWARQGHEGDPPCPPPPPTEPPPQPPPSTAPTS